MDHDLQTKTNAKDRVNKEASEYFNEAITTPIRRARFRDVAKDKFKDRWNNTEQKKFQMGQPHAYSAQEYCLIAETYLHQMKELIRLVGIEMLDTERYPTKQSDNQQA